MRKQTDISSPRTADASDPSVHGSFMGADPMPDVVRPRVEKIESEPLGSIHVGGGGKLIVPREDIDADVDDGEELDPDATRVLKCRKPGRNELIVLNRESELVTSLLVYRANPDDFGQDYYYVLQNLRDPIRDQIRKVRVFLYFSVAVKSFALWIIKISPGNSWYENLNALLNKDKIFFETSQLRIKPDLAEKRDRIKRKDFTDKIEWPTKTTEELLGEALGEDHFIRATDHPIYMELTDGEEVR